MSAEVERMAKYAEVIGIANNSETRAAAAVRVMAVADAEQVVLRAEVKRLRDGLSEVNADIHSLERDLAVERAARARVEALMGNWEANKGTPESEAWCHYVAERVRNAIANDYRSEAMWGSSTPKDPQNGSGRPVTPAPSTDTSEGSQGRTEAHSTPNEANRGRETKETR